MIYIYILFFLIRYYWYLFIYTIYVFIYTIYVCIYLYILCILMYRFLRGGGCKPGIPKYAKHACNVLYSFWGPLFCVAWFAFFEIA